MNDPKTRFAGRAADYVAGRPTYPEAAIDALFAGLGDPAEAAVADLGAGTGISSRLLASRGATVFAIEPNRQMRDAAVADARVTWLATSAEATGLEEASVDLVTAFQAFHWFEHRAALREMVRVLRPGGRAAVIYNERDERDAFTAAYGALVRRYQLDDTEQRRAHALDAFETFEGWRGGARRLEYANAQSLDLDRAIARARSTSYLPQDGPVAVKLHDQIRDLVARYERDGRVAMALRTIVATGDAGAGGG